MGYNSTYESTNRSWYTNVCPVLVKYLFVLEKCLQPKKPELAENGEGWGAFKTRCLLASIKLSFSWANLPQRRKTRRSFLSDKVLMAALVSFSQPMSRWEAGLLARTVRIVLRSKTPCLAQLSKLPFVLEIFTPRSLSISLKIFTSDGGGVMPFGTEKESPCACPLPWYGSWPRMTTLKSYGRI